MSIRKLIAHGVRWNTLTTMITSLSHFIIILTIARLLGPEELGQLATAWIWMRITLPALDLGLSNSYIQVDRISKLKASTLFWVQIILGIFLFTFTSFIFAHFFSRFYNDPELLILLRWFALAFLISAPGLLYSAALKKRLKFGMLSGIKITSVLTEMIVAILLLVFWQDILAVIIAYLARNIIYTSGVIGYGYHYFKPTLKFNFIKSWPQLRFGIFDFGAQIMNQFSTQVDRLIIGKVLGQSALGIYVLAWDLMITPVARISGVFNHSVYPVFARISESTDKLSKSYSAVLSIIWMIISPILIFLLLWAEPLIDVLFGGRWIEAASVLQILCLAGLFKGLSSTGYAIIMAKNRTDIGFLWNAMWTVLLSAGLLFSLALIPDVKAAAWTVVILTFGAGWLWHVMISRVGKVSYGEILIDLYKGSLMLIPMAAILLILKYLLSGMDNTLLLLSGSFLGIVIYLLTLWLFRPSLIRSLTKTYLH
ncbi:MAG: MOP flippase family protein [Saprospiraceae bacterium]|nr:MOP flippase family protein [Saprospiraceae bacterium]